MIFRLTFSGLLVLVCRLVVGGVFIYASLDKLQHPAAFAQAIDNYHLVPYSLLHVLAYLMPAAELVLGSALVLGVWRRGAALLTGLLTVVFMVAITTALIRGLDISCGCFHTDGGHGVGMSLLARDLILVIMCLPIWLARESGPAASWIFRRR